MGKFHPFPRRELRRLRAAWLRRNAGVVLCLVTGFALLAAMTSFLLIWMDPPGGEYLLGVLHAGVVAATLHLVNSAFLAHDRGALLQLRGAWGEDNTRSELQRAKRRRVVWGWVDSITLQVGDLEMTASARRMQLRAESLARTLLASDRRARHRAATPPFTVTAAVVLWGAARQTVPTGHQVDGVHFLDGRELVGWLQRLNGQGITREAAADVLERLTVYRSGSFSAGRK